MPPSQFIGSQSPKKPDNESYKYDHFVSFNKSNYSFSVFTVTSYLFKEKNTEMFHSYTILYCYKK